MGAARADRRVAAAPETTADRRPARRRRACRRAYRRVSRCRPRPTSAVACASVGLIPPETGDDWIGLTADPLPLDAAMRWAERASCGAVVLFSGTVRDHAEGRPGVSALEYEAYEEEVEPRLTAIAAEARARWPVVGRLVLLHRVGRLQVGESSVVFLWSAPH